MDPGIAWFQEEQEGPSKRLWLSIWDTIQEMEMEQQQQQQQNVLSNSTSRTGDSSITIPLIVYDY